MMTHRSGNPFMQRQHRREPMSLTSCASRQVFSARSLVRARQQAGNARAMEPEKPRRIRRCLGAIANGANDLLLLVSAQLGRTTHLDAAIAGGDEACSRS